MTTSSAPRYLTLRLLCANAVGMVAFLSAFVVAEDFALALGAGLIVGVIGYVASSAVVDYASAGAGDAHD